MAPSMVGYVGGTPNSGDTVSMNSMAIRIASLKSVLSETRRKISRMEAYCNHLEAEIDAEEKYMSDIVKDDSKDSATNVKESRTSEVD